MNIFSVGDGKEYELTREKYIEKTHKSFPFYQNPQRYKNPYFAICPACNNPIQIINLFGVQYKEDYTGNMTLHGRHCIKNVEGLPIYNRERYEACPLHNPVAFRIRQIRENEYINEEIRVLVENNRNKLAADIRKITGILLKNERINGIIDDYIVARDYCYTHTNRYNIPYNILYAREAINLFGQRIDESDLGDRITLAIRENSRCFGVESGRIVKKVEQFVSLHLLVIRHRIEGSKQYVTISIEERSNANFVLFQEEIEMRQFVY